MKAANDFRHYHFLNSLIETGPQIDRPFLSESIVKAINFHAIVGLHHFAGQYRTFPVEVADRGFPEHYRVAALMDDLVNLLNYQWQSQSAVELSAFAMWQVTNIHPFRNGNGRTARAVCYFILCVKSGGLLPGKTTLPEMLRTEARDEYISSLQQADKGDLVPLTTLVQRLLNQQLKE